jgi:hypothetical protein
MQTINIEIKNPKALKILKNLDDLELIKIRKKRNLKDLLKSLRSQSELIPSLTEITKEIESVRLLNYEKKA